MGTTDVMVRGGFSNRPCPTDRDRSVPRSHVLITDGNAVPEGVHTHRMGEHRRAIWRGIGDVVHQRTAGRIVPGEVAHALGDFMIRAGRVAAHSQASNDGTGKTVKGHSAPEGDDTTGDLVGSASASGGWR